MNLSKYYPDSIPVGIKEMLYLAEEPLTLEKMWALMDLAWAATNANIDNAESIKNFYAHPVWILNGIFTETHKESVYNRKIFSEEIISTKPKRIADYGGGFGALSRLIAKKLHECDIEIIEPFPSDLAISLCSNFENIKFKKELTGKYDIIIALDVLEHIHYPLDLVYTFQKFINSNGYLFLANCFYPVIKCHLPCTFYLRNYFDFLVRKMGFTLGEKVLYGRKYYLNKTILKPHDIYLWIHYAKILYTLKESSKNIYHCIKSLFNDEKHPSCQY